MATLIATYARSIYTSLIFAILLFSAPAAWADELEYATKMWTDIQLTHPLANDDQWAVFINPQFRFIDERNKFNLANLYVGLFDNLTPQLNLSAGGFVNDQKLSDGETQREFRLWQQLTWTIADNDPLTLSSRSRIEERKNADYDALAYRFRERFNLSIPIESPFLSQLFSPYTTALVIADELFIQLNEPRWVTQHVFSENRGSIGMSFSLSETASFEMGYLNQFQVAHPDRMGNVAYFMWKNRL